MLTGDWFGSNGIRWSWLHVGGNAAGSSNTCANSNSILLRSGGILFSYIASSVILRTKNPIPNKCNNVFFTHKSKLRTSHSSQYMSPSRLSEGHTKFLVIRLNWT